MVEQTSPERTFRRSFTLMFAVVIVLFVLLIARLWYLQIIQGTEMTQQSEANRIRTYRIMSSRGMIQDRWGELIVDNRPSFDLIFSPHALPQDQWPSFLMNISSEVGADMEKINARLSAGKGKDPIKIKEDITRDDLARVETLSMLYQGNEFPLNIEPIGKRTYLYGRLFSHVIGFTGEIDREQLESPEYAGYRPGDRVGRSGIEKAYEQDLRGEFGMRKVEENARGKQLQALEYTPAIPGKTLVLNIDMNLQRTAFRSMGNYAGAAIAMDPRNGQILALVSSPSFDPEMFNMPLSKEQWNEILEHPQHPMENKAIRGQYPPGSTFKVVSALAGLQEEVITPHKRFECRGKWKYLDRYFRCHNERGHGWVNFNNSLIRSCDIYYYKLSVELGIERIARYARLLGAGASTGIDIAGELTGLVPTPEWKMQRFGKQWLPGETLNTAIGQGSLMMTPLQMAVMYSAIANGGTLYQPQIIQKITTPDGKTIKEFKPQALRTVDIEARHFERLRKALMYVVNDPGGTAYKSRIKTFIYAGKTGTAQVRRIGKQRRHVSVLPYEHRDHAWFAAIAPANDPSIVVVVLCEHAGHGSVAAAPIAREILLAYRRSLRNHPELNNPQTEAGG